MSLLAGPAAARMPRTSVLISGASVRRDKDGMLRLLYPVGYSGHREWVSVLATVSLQVFYRIDSDLSVGWVMGKKITR